MAVGVVAVVSVEGISVNSGEIRAGAKKTEIHYGVAGGLVGDTGDKPVGGTTLLASDDIIFTDFTGKWHGALEIGRNFADKLEEVGEAFFVDEWAVGGHGHTGVDGNKVGELSGDGSRNALDAIFDVEDAISIVHTAGE